MAAEGRRGPRLRGFWPGLEASRQSVSLISLLSFLFAFAVHFVDRVNHFHAKINLNMGFCLKVVRFYREAKFERMGNHPLGLRLFPGAQPSHALLIIAPQNLLSRCCQC